jgi:AcrR family transcriptional regulator
VSGRTPRTGRRPGEHDTREHILAAAREAFAERGYDGATVRDVARRAGVDPALLYHYFGSKQQLFVAAMEIPFQWRQALPAILDGPRDELGERLVCQLLGYWEDPRIRPLLMGAVRSATTDRVAAEMVRRLLAEGPFAMVARTIGTPDAEMRAMLAASHVMGVALLRYILRIEPMASAPIDRLASMVGPTVQHYLSVERLEA